MKKIFLMMMAAMLAGVLAVSCFDDDTINSPLAVITSFAVDDIETEFVVLASDSTDSTYTLTIDGDDIYFQIDQVNNRIYSVDSIVYWADITRVVPIIGYSGYLYIRTGDDTIAYAFTSGSDSVDFTQKVEFIVLAYDGSDAKTYTAELYQAVTLEDSVYWVEQKKTGLELEGDHRLVSLGDTLFLFADNNGEPTVTWSATADSTLSWTEPTVIEGATIDFESVTVFGDALYALDATGTLYRSTASSGGAIWEQASQTPLMRLLCADNTYLYAYDGGQIVRSSDLQTWTPNGSADLDCLPNRRIHYCSYDFRTNEALENVVMLGLSDGVDDYAAAWFKVSSSDEELDQDWGYISITGDNDYGMAKLESLCMVRFNGVLYAFGYDAEAAETVDGLGYETVYKSNDNGVTWHEMDGKISLPEALNKADGAAIDAAVANGLLWIVQDGGRVWRGEMLYTNEK